MTSDEPLYMSKIEGVEGLWLGCKDATLDKESLDRCGVYHILSLREPEVKKELQKQQFTDRTYHRFWIYDKDSADLSQYFMDIITIIYNCLERRPRSPILVQCRAGCSRSAAAVAAYLIYRDNHRLQSANDAVERICRTRIVSPNDGFLRQLDVFAILRYRLPRSPNNSKRRRHRRRHRK